MYQKITIVGNLGNAPQMRYLPDGTPVVGMSVAANRVYNDQSGQQVKETTWFRVSVFGKQAEACAQYLAKGRQVLVEGRLRPDKETGSPRLWQRQDGSYAASFEVIAATVRFLGGRGDASQAAEGEGEDVLEAVDEDSLPF